MGDSTSGVQSVSADRREGVNRHLLALILIPLCIVAATASYVRFVVAMNYVIEFEGDCDPSTESCFHACEDDSCAAVYYYSLVQKHAADVYAQCGPDITDCDAAYTCLEGERCTIVHCEPDSGECIGPGASIEESHESRFDEIDENL